MEIVDKKPESEERIQSQIVTWFTNNYCLKHHSPRSIIFAVPNGGLRNAREAVVLKSTGTLAGCADIILIHNIQTNPPALLFPTILIFCEVKTLVGRQSPEQRDFEQRVASLGYIYRIVRSLEEFKSLIREIESGAV